MSEVLDVVLVDDSFKDGTSSSANVGWYKEYPQTAMVRTAVNIRDKLIFPKKLMLLTYKVVLMMILSGSYVLFLFFIP
jgi:hypothetical protein